jgi:hypothetical protein
MVLKNIADFRHIWSNAGVFTLYLLKGHILKAERFAGRIHALQSKVCILLQDMPTNISLHKHIQDGFVILFMYLFIYDLWFILIIIIYLFPPLCKNSLL